MHAARSSPQGWGGRRRQGEHCLELRLSFGLPVDRSRLVVRVRTAGEGVARCVPVLVDAGIRGNERRAEREAIITTDSVDNGILAGEEVGSADTDGRSGAKGLIKGCVVGGDAVPAERLSRPSEPRRGVGVDGEWWAGESSGEPKENGLGPRSSAGGSGSIDSSSSPNGLLITSGRRRPPRAPRRRGYLLFLSLPLSLSLSLE
eukprot:scaffold139316_cov31-Tisochrysis_lutea.AAC.5